MNTTLKGGRWLGAAVLLLVMLSMAVKVLEQGPPSESPSERGNASGGSVRALPNLITDNFSLFRSPSSSLPFSLMTHLGSSSLGAYLPFAQRLHMGAWVVPEVERVCLIKQKKDGAVTAACARIERVLSHGIFVASLKDPSMRGSGPRRKIIGLAPDRTHAVRLITPNFTDVTVDVSRGVFVHRDNIPASPQSVTLIRD